MKIQTQAFIAIGIFALLCAFFFYFLIRPVVLEEAEGFDRYAIEENTERVESFIRLEQKNLQLLNRDWAVWDDTYSFVRGGQKNYETNNLMDETFSNNKIQYMMYLNSQNEVVYKRGFDFENEKELDISSDFIEEAAESIQASAGPAGTFYQSINNEAVMMTYNEILRSDESGTPAGFLIMGRVLDQAYVETLSEALSIDLSLEEDAYPASVQNLSNSQLTAGVNIEGIEEQDNFPLAVIDKRFFYKEKKESLNELVLYLTAGLILLCSMLLLIFKRFVTTPVSELAGQMKSIQFNEDLSTRVSLARRKNREVEQLEESINVMLASLESTHGKVLEMAYFDQLTGLSNRFHLYQEFPRYDREHTAPKALLFFDLDGFKGVNDTWGHEAGDALLKQVADRLRQCFASKEVILSRVGGDEFVVVTAYDQKEVFKEEITNVSEILNEQYLLGHIKADVTASIGVSITPGDGTELSALLKHADMAMYEAKSSGKGTFVFYEQLSDNSRYHQVAELKKEVADALKKNQLYVVYQPVYEAITHRVRGVEALLRWNHPEKGTILPELFISLLEETGLIHDAGVWVLRESLKQINDWRGAGVCVSQIAVNFSKAQLKHADEFLQSLDEALIEFRVPPEQLAIEITESEAVFYDEDIVYFIQELKARSVRVVLDDFGVGTSTLYSLRDLPLDGIKIDRSFLQRVPRESFDASLLTGLYQIFHELNIDVTTEGVETIEQLDFVEKTSLTNIQGFCFSEPLLPEEMEKMLKEKMAEHL